MCTGKNHTKCGYDRVVPVGWMMLIEVVHLLEFFIVPLLLLAGVMDLKRYLSRRVGRKASISKRSDPAK
jgi:hypothetical protein